MGDDMLIIAMNRLVIMHDQRHIHVIMNIIVNPISWEEAIIMRRRRKSDPFLNPKHCQRHNGPRHCFYDLNYLSSYKAGKFTWKENSS